MIPRQESEVRSQETEERTSEGEAKSVQGEAGPNVERQGLILTPDSCFSSEESRTHQMIIFSKRGIMSWGDS
jgi:hypothetical protein